MSLLHATWLPAIRTPSSTGRPALLVWADTWRVASPTGPEITPAVHPFTLEPEDLKIWLSAKGLLPAGAIDTTACLTLPSRILKSNIKKKSLRLETEFANPNLFLSLTAGTDVGF